MRLCVSLATSYTSSQQRRSRLVAPVPDAPERTKWAGLLLCNVFKFRSMFSYHITRNYPLQSLIDIMRESPVRKQDDVKRYSSNHTLPLSRPLGHDEVQSLSGLRFGPRWKGGAGKLGLGYPCLKVSGADRDVCVSYTLLSDHRGCGVLHFSADVLSGGCSRSRRAPQWTRLFICPRSVCLRVWQGRQGADHPVSSAGDQVGLPALR